MVRKLATFVGRNNAKTNNILSQRIIGRTLFLGILGTKNVKSEPNPLIKKNASKIIIYLFI